MRMRGSSHPGTEVLIEYNSTPTGTPGDPGPGCQAEPLPHHFLSDSGSQSLGLRVQSHVDRGKGPHPEETQGEDRGSPRDACVALRTAVGDHGMWRPDMTSLTPLRGRSDGLGHRACVQVSRLKEPSCAGSQGRILTGALGPQDIQVVTAFIPGRPRQACGNEPSLLLSSQGSWLGEMLALRRAKMAAEGGA